MLNLLLNRSKGKADIKLIHTQNKAQAHRVMQPSRHQGRLVVHFPDRSDFSDLPGHKNMSKAALKSTMPLLLRSEATAYLSGKAIKWLLRLFVISPLVNKGTTQATNLVLNWSNSMLFKKTLTLTVKCTSKTWRFCTNVSLAVCQGALDLFHFAKKCKLRSYFCKSTYNRSIQFVLTCCPFSFTR